MCHSLCFHLYAIGHRPRERLIKFIVENPKATAIWGFRGFYGVLEVLTKKQYRTYKKEGKLEDDWQILK